MSFGDCALWIFGETNDERGRNCREVIDRLLQIYDYLIDHNMLQEQRKIYNEMCHEMIVVYEFSGKQMTREGLVEGRNSREVINRLLQIYDYLIDHNMIQE
jgi:hypothetical protein